MTRLPLAAVALAGLSQAVCGQPADDAVARFKACLQWEGAARLERDLIHYLAQVRHHPLRKAVVRLFGEMLIQVRIALPHLCASVIEA